MTNASILSEKSHLLMAFSEQMNFTNNQFRNYELQFSQVSFWPIIIFVLLLLLFLFFLQRKSDWLRNSWKSRNYGSSRNVWHSGHSRNSGNYEEYRFSKQSWESWNLGEIPETQEIPETLEIPELREVLKTQKQIPGIVLCCHYGRWDTIISLNIMKS